METTKKQATIMNMSKYDLKKMLQGIVKEQSLEDIDNMKLEIDSILSNKMQEYVNQVGLTISKTIVDRLTSSLKKDIDILINLLNNINNNYSEIKVLMSGRYQQENINYENIMTILNKVKLKKESKWN